MNEIILAIIVVLILLLILVCLFLFTIKRVNILVKKIFVDKLQEYDFLIEDKEKKVEELNKDIETKKSNEKELQDTYDSRSRVAHKCIIDEHFGGVYYKCWNW